MIVCIILASVVSVWSVAVGRPSRPATQPAATEPTTRSAPAGALGQIENILEPDRKEKLIVSDVQDYSTQLDEPALYLMLSKAARLPTLSGKQFDQLDQPSYHNMLNKPRRYRLLPVRITVMAYAVKKLHTGPDGGLSPSPHWPKDKPVWRIDCLHAPGGDERRKEPMRIFSVADPTEILGEPDRTEAGELIYAPGRRLDIAGVFYKVYSGSTVEGKRGNFPVVIAWQYRSGAGGLFVETATHPIVVTALAGVALLAGGYLVIRRHISRIRRARSAPREYRPKRDTAEEPGRQSPSPETDYVDPLLKEAVEEHRKQARHKRQEQARQKHQEHDQNDKN